MRRVDERGQLARELQLAAAEAGAAFGDARLYLERFVTHGRHIEVQVLGDGKGRVLHLGERDCSVQRRHQKLIEETPAPRLAPAMREQICAAAVRYATSLQYRSAGTVEFLFDAQRDAFYFLEMNARIQVEHPVTEMVSGVDLVAEQLRIAAGQELAAARAPGRPDGCAIECRINAEDPDHGFMPSPGRVTLAEWPRQEGVRVDTWIESGSMVPPWYDSLLGKIIAHGATREAALARLRGALAATRIEGVRTNLALQAELLDSAEFTRGGVDTGWLDGFMRRRAVAGAPDG
jgi:acetyl-CoA carboxylase biotin carboxylase subunit